MTKGDVEDGALKQTLQTLLSNSNESLPGNHRPH